MYLFSKRSILTNGIRVASLCLLCSSFLSFATVCLWAGRADFGRAWRIEVSWLTGAEAPKRRQIRERFFGGRISWVKPVHLSAHLPYVLRAKLSECVSVCLFVCLSVCLFVCVCDLPYLWNLLSAYLCDYLLSFFLMCVFTLSGILLWVKVQLHWVCFSLCLCLCVCVLLR